MSADPAQRVSGPHLTPTNVSQARVEVIVAQTRISNGPYYLINPSGRVRTLTFAPQTKVFADDEGKERLIGFLTATLIAMEGREAIAD